MSSALPPCPAPRTNLCGGDTAEVEWQDKWIEIFQPFIFFWEWTKFWNFRLRFLLNLNFVISFGSWWVSLLHENRWIKITLMQRVLFISFYLIAIVAGWFAVFSLKIEWVFLFYTVIVIASKRFCIFESLPNINRDSWINIFLVICFHYEKSRTPIATVIRCTSDPRTAWSINGLLDFEMGGCNFLYRFLIAWIMFR